MQLPSLAVRGVSPSLLAYGYLHYFVPPAPFK